MSDTITAAYEDYYLGQKARIDQTQSVALVHRLVSALRTEFPDDLSGYLELNDRLFGLWEQYCGQSDPENWEYFSTSGSSRSAPRKYQVGPYANLWVQALWEMTRFPLGWRVIVNLNPIFNRDTPLRVVADSAGLPQHIVTCSLAAPNSLPELLDVFRHFLTQYPAYSILSTPDAFLYLNRQEAFQEFVIENRRRINLMSQLWEPFYSKTFLLNQGVHCSDAMVDWTTGLNFHTCSTGEQHTYPLFATSGDRRVNLMNLMPTPELGPGRDDDLFEPLSVAKCACGQNRLVYRFVPHQPTAVRTANGEIVYDVELAEQLTSQLHCVQFIQERDIVTIFYRCEGELRDEELLRDYFERRGFQVHWKPDDSYSIGIKRPVFYQYRT
jgi:hypothetical protein